MEDPFDEPDEGIERDQWGRPLIKPPPDGWPGPPGVNGEKRDGTQRRPYTRASKLPSELDSGFGLTIWTRRHLAMAMARAGEGTIALIKSCNYGDKQIDTYIEQVLEQAKRDEHDLKVKGVDRADWGMAFHRFTEPNSPPDVPQKIAADVRAFYAALEQHDLEIVDTEFFVVNDLLQSAGTVDHLVRHRRTGVLYILDKKTGDLHPISMSCQLAIYNGAERYDSKTGERSPIADPWTALDMTRAIVAQAPHGEGKCELWNVDVVAGRQLARLAQTIREWRKNEESLMSLWT
jgi:hypothetical protein